MTYFDFLGWSTVSLILSMIGYHRPVMVSRILFSSVKRLEEAHKRLEHDNITNTLSALSVESRTADMIRRLVYIRARLMKPSSRIEAKKQKIRAQRERRHIPGVVLKRQFSKKKFSKKLLKFVTDRLRTSLKAFVILNRD